MSTLNVNRDSLGSLNSRVAGRICCLTGAALGVGCLEKKKTIIKSVIFSLPHLGLHYFTNTGFRSALKILSTINKQEYKKHSAEITNLEKK